METVLYLDPLTEDLPRAQIFFDADQSGEVVLDIDGALRFADSCRAFILGELKIITEQFPPSEVLLGILGEHPDPIQFLITLYKKMLTQHGEAFELQPPLAGLKPKILFREVGGEVIMYMPPLLKEFPIGKRAIWWAGWLLGVWEAQRQLANKAGRYLATP